VTVTRVLNDVVGVCPERTTLPDDIDPADRSTRSATTRTDLALERTRMAAERTLMAWVRTSLAMISFGFTLGKVGDALGSAKVNLLFGRTTDIVGVAYYLVILGTLALILAAVQNRVEVTGLFRQGLTRRPSLAFFIAILLSLLGMFVFMDLVTRFR
jgi:putative membrane protein